MKTDSECTRRLRETLLTCETATGGWSYYPAEAQPHLEPTCLSLLALRYCAESRVTRGLAFLLHSQNPNGSWPAFVGDDQEGCWVTALAVLTLHQFRAGPNAIDRGVNWLLDSKGKESHWLWKWKFRTSDTHVRFDPDKFGWPWMPETNSWVVPTSFALLALTQCFPSQRPSRVRDRFARGIEMLLDRVCPDGGWNAGNGVVYGAPLAPHLDATAIALLALRGQKQDPIITASLSWLEDRSFLCSAPSSLAWSILALQAHGQIVTSQIERLAHLANTAPIHEYATLATVALALGCTTGKNVFAVQS
jgi:hypothetical protein